MAPEGEAELVVTCGCDQLHLEGARPWLYVACTDTAIVICSRLLKSMTFSESYLGEMGPHRATQQFVKIFP